MPAADKLAVIANYLGVSSDYLLGLTNNSMPIKKDLDEDGELSIELEKVNEEYKKMTPKKRKQYREYAEFLKMQEEFSAELDDLDENIIKRFGQEQSELPNE